MRRLAIPLALAVAFAGGVPANAGDVSSAQSETCVPRGSNSKGHRTTRSRARRVVERYASETMRRCDGVEGMGVGAKTADGSPPRSGDKVHHIAIFLRDEDSRPPRTRSIAGVRIVWVVTGEFRPL